MKLGGVYGTEQNKGLIHGTEHFGDSLKTAVREPPFRQGVVNHHFGSIILVPGVAALLRTVKAASSTFIAILQFFDVFERSITSVCKSYIKQNFNKMKL